MRPDPQATWLARGYRPAPHLPSPEGILGARCGLQMNQSPLSSPPPFLVWEDVRVFNRLTRLRHHRGNFLSPSIVVRGLLMSGRVIGSTIDFHQDKLSLIIFFGLIYFNLRHNIVLVGINLDEVIASVNRIADF